VYSQANGRGHHIYELMAGVALMQEPVGAALGVIAESIGTSGEALRLLIGIIGMAFLGASFSYSRTYWSRRLAAAGWLFLGLFIYLLSEYYVKIGDPVLIIMTAGALPAGVFLAFLETQRHSHLAEETKESLIWLRGMVAWSMIPYQVVYCIPYLNIAFVMLTAHSAEWMLEFVGLGSYSMGEVMVDLHDGGEVPLRDWDGSMILLTQPLGDGGFFIPMYHSNGEEVNIGFILSCSGLQSMIIFVGAIVALQTVPWNRRIRGLLISVPTIHILNTFRNAGIVWLTDNYQNWQFLGLDMFDFSHSYAAKVASLFAMFLLAIALFDLLPELHRNIMQLMPKQLRSKGNSSTTS
tara:strand:- start:198 stop:1250 length:1053 start_codon:yes stop_codon:yes gene_type:complete